MAEHSTTELHRLADEAAQKGQFLEALRYAAEVLRVGPLDHRARLKVGLASAALSRMDEAVQIVGLAADVAYRQGSVLAAIGICRDGLALKPGARKVRDVLLKIHAGIHGLEGAPRPRARPPVAPLRISLEDEESLLGVQDGEALLGRAVSMGLLEPQDLAQEPSELSRVPVFSELPRAAFVDLIEKLGYLKVPRNHAVIRQGDDGKALYMLLTGEVRVVRTQSEEEQVLAELRAGSIFGEHSLVTDRPRGASVVTTQPSELFEISRAHVESLAEKHPALVEQLVGFARKRLLENLLRTSKVFAPFDEADKAKILKSFVVQIVEGGAPIIEEGQEPVGLFLLADGRVEVTKVDEADDRVILAHLSAGDVFGEIALLSKQPATATVTAAEKCVVLLLSREKLSPFIDAHPSIAKYLESLAQDRQKDTDDAMSQEGLILEVDDLMIL